MKTTRIVLVLVAVALVVTGVVLSRTRGRANPADPTKIHDVDPVAQNPAAFAGQEFRLQGVVSAVLPEKRLFVVIDQAEYASCNVVTCSEAQIPIAYAGDLPAVETRVTVTGQLTQQEPGRYLFQATALEQPQ